MLDNYEWFKDRVLTLTKIDLNAYKERQMKRRIDALIDKNSCKTYEEYIRLIQSDASRMKEFVNYLTINVSEFYRNPLQWQVLEEEVIPMLKKQFNGKLKIWSAACSTGDEPYSLVMMLAKHFPMDRSEERRVGKEC